jgi:hypothetical protein
MQQGLRIAVRSPRKQIRSLLRAATTSDGDAAILARGGRGGAGGKSKGGQDNGDQGDFADDHGDLEGIK